MLKRLLSATLVILQQKRHSPLAVIRACAVLLRRVRMTYRKIDGTIVVRDVEPYSLREGRARDGGALLYAFDAVAGHIKAFKPEGLISAVPSGLFATFRKRWNIEL